MSLRIGTSLALGALVGIERERKHRPAGFRTMILISLGSAGFMLVGQETIAGVVAEGGAPTVPGVLGGPIVPAAFGQAEISRTLQGLMGGIGFLGAGAVIQNKRAVKGLTTAAAVWVTSCMGATCGLGLYKLAILLAVATLFTLIVLDRVEQKYFPDPEEWENGKRRKDEGDGVGRERMQAAVGVEREVVVVVRE